MNTVNIFESITDPKERAKAEWKANHEDCNTDFVDEDSYVGYRTAQLNGRVNVTTAPVMASGRFK